MVLPSVDQAGVGWSSASVEDTIWVLLVEFGRYLIWFFLYLCLYLCICVFVYLCIFVSVTEQAITNLTTFLMFPFTSVTGSISMVKVSQGKP